MSSEGRRPPRSVFAALRGSDDDAAFSPGPAPDAAPPDAAPAPAPEIEALRERLAGLEKALASPGNSEAEARIAELERRLQSTQRHGEESDGQLHEQLDSQRQRIDELEEKLRQAVDKAARPQEGDAFMGELASLRNEVSRRLETFAARFDAASAARIEGLRERVELVAEQGAATLAVVVGRQSQTESELDVLREKERSREETAAFVDESARRQEASVFMGELATLRDELSRRVEALAEKFDAAAAARVVGLRARIELVAEQGAAALAIAVEDSARRHAALEERAAATTWAVERLEKEIRETILRRLIRLEKDSGGPSK